MDDRIGSTVAKCEQSGGAEVMKMAPVYVSTMTEMILRVAWVPRSPYVFPIERRREVREAVRMRAQRQLKH